MHPDKSATEFHDNISIDYTKANNNVFCVSLDDQWNSSKNKDIARPYHSDSIHLLDSEMQISDSAGINPTNVDRNNVRSRSATRRSKNKSKRMHLSRKNRLDYSPSFESPVMPKNHSYSMIKRKTKSNSKKIKFSHSGDSIVRAAYDVKVDMPQGNPNTNVASKTVNSTQKANKKPKQNRVTVAVRLRPLNDAEIRGRIPLVWHIKNPKTIAYNYPGDKDCHAFEFQHISTPYPENQVTKNIANSTSSLYRTVGKKIVQASCQGINGTIFAYGQTASGKTYTMLGTSADPGIILLALSDIFHYIKKSRDRQFALRISYLEIHNEIVNDLLNLKNTNLKIVDHKTGPIIRGCSEISAQTPHEVVQLLLKGEANRKMAETHSNLRSSRSHAIFRIFIQSRNAQKKDSKMLTSTLNLVDLAGSESISHMDKDDVSLQKECKHINQSLLGLGRVILALSTNKHHSTSNNEFSMFGSYASSHSKTNAYVPYRDSKLTRILQPSLGGNAQTCIICTISAGLNCKDESMNTLRFAQFAKKVTNHAKINESIDDQALLKKYQAMVQRLQMKIKKYTVQAKQSQEKKIIYKKSMKKLKIERKVMQEELERQKQRGIEMQSQLKTLKHQLQVSKTNSQRDTGPHTPQNSGTNGNDESLCETPFTPSEPSISVKSSVTATHMTNIILGLQSQLEEVQQDIKQLATRIENTAVIDASGIHTPASMISPQKRSTTLGVQGGSPNTIDPIPTKNTNDNNNRHDQKVSAQDIPIISIDLNDVTTGKPNKNESEHDSLQELKIMLENLEKENLWLKSQFQCEKKHSDQVLNMVSGSHMYKIKSKNGTKRKVRLYVHTEHDNNKYSKSRFCLSWKRVTSFGTNPKSRSNSESLDSTQNVKMITQLNDTLGSKLSKLKTIPFDQIVEIKVGQKTDAFLQANKAFSDQEKLLSFSVITKNRSFDFICLDENDHECWATGLSRLLETSSENPETDEFKQLFTKNESHIQPNSSIREKTEPLLDAISIEANRKLPQSPKYVYPNTMVKTSKNESMTNEIANNESEKVQSELEISSFLESMATLSGAVTASDSASNPEPNEGFGES